MKKKFDIGEFTRIGEVFLKHNPWILPILNELKTQGHQMMGIPFTMRTPIEMKELAVLAGYMCFEYNVDPLKDTNFGDVHKKNKKRKKKKGRR